MAHIKAVNPFSDLSLIFASNSINKLQSLSSPLHAALDKGYVINSLYKD